MFSCVLQGKAFVNNRRGDLTKRMAKRAQLKNPLHDVFLRITVVKTIARQDEQVVLDRQRPRLTLWFRNYKLLEF